MALIFIILLPFFLLTTRFTYYDTNISSITPFTNSTYLNLSPLCTRMCVPNLSIYIPNPLPPWNIGKHSLKLLYHLPQRRTLVHWPRRMLLTPYTTILTTTYHHQLFNLHLHYSSSLHIITDHCVPKISNTLFVYYWYFNFLFSLTPIKINSA